jgi:hypothetical protein
VRCGTSCEAGVQGRKVVSCAVTPPAKTHGARVRQRLVAEDAPTASDRRRAHARGSRTVRSPGTSQRQRQRQRQHQHRHPSPLVPPYQHRHWLPVGCLPGPTTTIHRRRKRRASEPASRKAFHEHVALVHRPRDLRCPVDDCAKRVARQCVLNRHVRRRHPDPSAVRSQCGERVASADALV